MRISVVIPTYRRPDLLRRCLGALALQRMSLTAFEVIVVSDGPDTLTAEVVTDFAAANPQMSVRVRGTSAKAGPAAARNKGWRHAKAELIAFTDDDCIPAAIWLESMWDAFCREAKNIAAFSGRTVVPISSPPTDYELNISHLEEAEFITANCACTRQALETVNGFDEQFTMAWREDSDLHFKFIIHNIPLVKVAEAEVIHPVRRHKWAVSIRDEKKGIFNVLLYKKYPQLYVNKIEKHVPLTYYLICISLVVMITAMLLKLENVLVPASLVWAALTIAFALKRLRRTSRSASHILEMLVTSMIIPVLSLYYRLYGSIKYGVLLL